MKIKMSRPLSSGSSGNTTISNNNSEATIVALNAIVGTMLNKNPNKNKHNSERKNQESATFQQPATVRTSSATVTTSKKVEISSKFNQPPPEKWT